MVLGAIFRNVGGELNDTVKPAWRLGRNDAEHQRWNMMRRSGLYI